MLEALLQRFEVQAPVATMVRATMANVLAPAQLDEIFRDTAVQQREGELLFSSVVGLLHLAVLKTKPSLHAAYQSQHEELGVSVKSVYEKLAHVELPVTRELVRRTATGMRNVLEALGSPPREVLPGYRVRVLDGSHLRATERRLDEQRMLNGAPLPGQALVVLDPQRMLIEDIIPSEDGHSQERLLLHELVEDLRPGDVWIADRNFCTSMWLREIALNKSWFIIRQHGSFIVEELNRPVRIGRTSKAQVFEQRVQHVDEDEDALLMRRITIKLYEPTADGETEIVILSNLPDSVEAVPISEAYGDRWSIEGVFGELTLSLNGEINTLAYPPSALLAYALALVTYNLLSVVRGAVAAVQGEATSEAMSTYYMAEEIASTHHGMGIALPWDDWFSRFGNLQPASLAEELKRMAAHVQLRRYRKHPRGPKKLPPTRTGSYQHVSTKRLLDQRKC